MVSAVFGVNLDDPQDHRLRRFCMESRKFIQQPAGYLLASTWIVTNRFFARRRIFGVCKQNNKTKKKEKRHL